jgi:hypothetical protein
LRAFAQNKREYTNDRKETQTFHFRAIRATRLLTHR